MSSASSKRVLIFQPIKTAEQTENPSSQVPAPPVVIPSVLEVNVEHELELTYLSEIYSLQQIHELQRGSVLSQMALNLAVPDEIRNFPPLNLAMEQRQQGDRLMSLGEMIKPKTDHFLALLSFHSNLPVVQVHGFRRDPYFLESPESCQKLKALQAVPVERMVNHHACVAFPMISSETHRSRVAEVLGVKCVVPVLTSPESMRRAWKEFEERRS